MEKRVDAPTAEGNRFVEVAPPQSPVGLSPYTYYDQEPRATIGEFSRIVLRVEDVQRTYEELTAKGVRFDGEPFQSTGGIFAAMRDPRGNFFVLSESRSVARS